MNEEKNSTKEIIEKQKQKKCIQSKSCAQKMNNSELNGANAVLQILILIIHDKHRKRIE